MNALLVQTGAYILKERKIFASFFQDHVDFCLFLAFSHLFLRHFRVWSFWSTGYYFKHISYVCSMKKGGNILSGIVSSGL